MRFLSAVQSRVDHRFRSNRSARVPRAKTTFFTLLMHFITLFSLLLQVLSVNEPSKLRIFCRDSQCQDVLSKGMTVSRYPSSSSQYMSFEVGQKLKILGLSEDKSVYYVEIGDKRGLVPALNSIKVMSNLKSTFKNYELNYEIENGVFKTKNPVTVAPETEHIQLDPSITATYSKRDISTESLLSLSSRTLSATPADHFSTKPLSIPSDATISSAEVSNVANIAVATKVDSMSTAATSTLGSFENEIKESESSLNPSAKAAPSTTAPLESKITSAFTSPDTLLKSNYVSTGSTSEATFVLTPSEQLSADTAISSSLSATKITGELKQTRSIDNLPSVEITESSSHPEHLSETLAPLNLASSQTLSAIYSSIVPESLSIAGEHLSLQSQSPPTIPQASILQPLSQPIKSESISTSLSVGSISSSTITIGSSKLDDLEVVSEKIFSSSSTIQMDHTPLPTIVKPIIESSKHLEPEELFDDSDEEDEDYIMDTSGIKTENQTDSSVESITKSAPSQIPVENEIEKNPAVLKDNLHVEPEKSHLEKKVEKNEFVAKTLEKSSDVDSASISNQEKLKSTPKGFDNVESKSTEQFQIKNGVQGVVAEPIREQNNPVNEIKPIELIKPIGIVKPIEQTKPTESPEPIKPLEVVKVPVEIEVPASIYSPELTEIVTPNEPDATTPNPPNDLTHGLPLHKNTPELIPTVGASKLNDLEKRPQSLESNVKTIGAKLLQEDLVLSAIDAEVSKISFDLPETIGHCERLDHTKEELGNSGAVVETLKPVLDMFVWFLPQSLADSLRYYFGLSIHLVVFTALIGMIWAIMHSVELFYHYSSKETTLKNALCDYQSKMFKLKTERDQLRSLLKNEKDKISQIEFQAKESNQSSALLENEIDRFKNDNAQLVRQVQALRERMTEQTALLKVECSATMDIKKENLRLKLEHESTVAELKKVSAELIECKSKLTESIEQVSQLTDELEEVRVRYDVEEQQNGTLVEKIKELESQQVQLQQNLEASGKELKTLTHTIDLKEGEINTLKQMFAEMRQQSTSGEEENESEEYEEVEKEGDQLDQDETDKVGEKETEKDKVKEKREFKDVKDIYEIARIRAELKQLEKEYSEIQIEFERVQSENESQKIKLVQLETENAQLSSDLKESSKVKEDAEGELESLQKQCSQREAELQQQVKALQDKEEQLQIKTKSLSKLVDELTKDAETYRSELDEARTQLFENEKNWKTEISKRDKTVFDNWTALKYAEREAENAKREAEYWRQQLTIKSMKPYSSEQNPNSSKSFSSIFEMMPPPPPPMQMPQFSTIPFDGSIPPNPLLPSYVGMGGPGSNSGSISGAAARSLTSESPKNTMNPNKVMYPGMGPPVHNYGYNQPPTTSNWIGSNSQHSTFTSLSQRGEDYTSMSPTATSGPSSLIPNKNEQLDQHSLHQQHLQPEQQHQQQPQSHHQHQEHQQQLQHPENLHHLQLQPQHPQQLQQQPQHQSHAQLHQTQPMAYAQPQLSSALSSSISYPVDLHYAHNSSQHEVEQSPTSPYSSQIAYSSQTPTDPSQAYAYTPNFTNAPPHWTRTNSSSAIYPSSIPVDQAYGSSNPNMPTDSISKTNQHTSNV